MEKGSIIGLPLAIIGVFVGAVLKGADPIALVTNVPAILIVVIGSLGAALLSTPLKEAKFGTFGKDNPKTPVRESISFAIQVDKAKQMIAINAGVAQHASLIVGSPRCGPRGGRRSTSSEGYAPGRRSEVGATGRSDSERPATRAKRSGSHQRRK